MCVEDGQAAAVAALSSEVTTLLFLDAAMRKDGEF
jgi:hypothetical protein